MNLDAFLSLLGQKHQPDSGSKYGANIVSPDFIMRPYCWCDNCPYCEGCSCEREFLVDNIIVPFQKFIDIFADSTEDYPYGSEEYEKAANAANLRRQQRITEKCNFCKLPNLEIGRDPGKQAPNFWYKPFDFKVTWYKYLSRATETNKSLTKEEFDEMVKICLSWEKI